jgi:hypothetical protein
LATGCEAEAEAEGDAEDAEGDGAADDGTAEGPAGLAAGDGVRVALAPAVLSSSGAVPISTRPAITTMASRVMSTPLRLIRIFLPGSGSWGVSAIGVWGPDGNISGKMSSFLGPVRHRCGLSRRRSCAPPP